jgi:hypothetical protein
MSAVEDVLSSQNVTNAAFRFHSALPSQYSTSKVDYLFIFPDSISRRQYRKQL